MWVQNGKHISKDSFSTTFRNLMEKYVGCAITPRSWRHVAVGMAREYIPPSAHLNNTLDLVLAHTTHQARFTYAGVAGDVPMMTNDAIWEYRDTSHAWWEVVGVGSVASLPRPLRLIRMGLPSSVPGLLVQQLTLETLTTALTSALQKYEGALVRDIIADLVNNVVSQFAPLPAPQYQYSYNPVDPATSSAEDSTVTPATGLGQP
jgi:hypothetical protein